jgi:Activator of Hsp90 ATPase homolog 1-like protein
MTQLEIRPAPVRRSVLVKTDVDRAFTAFTGRIGRWWPRTHTIGTVAQADVILEPRPGGRWYERGTDGSECEWGKVLIWDPPGRLVLAWQVDANWKYDPTLVLEVEVTFTPVEAALTRVDLEHRNLERYGEKAAIVRDMIGSDRGWLGILESYALEAESSSSPGG